MIQPAPRRRTLISPRELDYSARVDYQGGVMRKEVYLVNAASNTFFAIARHGTTIRERWGSLGADGENESISCRSESLADFLLDARIERKLRRGYAQA